MNMYVWADVSATSKAHAFFVRKHDDVSLVAACGVGSRQEEAPHKPECRTCQRIVFQDGPEPRR